MDKCEINHKVDLSPLTYFLLSFPLVHPVAFLNIKKPLLPRRNLESGTGEVNYIGGTIGVLQSIPTKLSLNLFK